MAFNTPMVGTMEGFSGHPFSIRLVVDGPLGCVSSFTSTNTSVVAFRIRYSSSVSSAVTGVGSEKVGPKLILGPGAPT